ncbi:MAG: armadillo-type fold-containing protein [Nostocaceae cyanobacterium]|nr:armadillo-type fold-containing protein [Nostocaceae cyanobacterium]
MAQASFSWQQLIQQLPNWALLEFKIGAKKQRTLQRFRGPGVVLWFLTIFVAMILWNWKLLLAMSVGIGIMPLVYSMHQWRWQQNWSEIRRFLNSPNSRLILAVISGGVACITTYIATAIWVDSSSPWIAAGAILQGLGTLLTLILLLWQIIHFYGERQENHLDDLLLNLTAADPLKRLLAVRQLTKLFHRQRVDTVTGQNIAECLRLLLTREEEAGIRQAAFESLQALEQLHVFPSSTAIKLAPAKSKIKHPVYESVDY